MIYNQAIRFEQMKYDEKTIIYNQIKEYFEFHENIKKYFETGNDIFENIKKKNYILLI